MHTLFAMATGPGFSRLLLVLAIACLPACIEYNISGSMDGSGIDVECRDNVDNDHDGWIDGADPDCAARIAITELGFGSSACNDGLDNDGDGKVDAEDEHCLNALYTHEGSFLGEVLITEFMANPLATTDANGEWIELYNMTAVAVDIRGWIMQDSAGSHVIGSSVIIPGRSYIVISRASNVVNGLPALHLSSYVYGSAISLSNTGDSISLLDNTGMMVHEVFYTAAQLLEGYSTQMSADDIQGPGLPALPRWCISNDVMNGAGSDKASPAQQNALCAVAE